MTSDELATKVAIEAERVQRRDALSRLHQTLHSQRAELKRSRSLPGLPDRTRLRLSRFIDNELENLMWDIETSLHDETSE